MFQTLTPLLLVNAALIVAFGFFAACGQLCVTLGISPYFAVLAFVAGYVWIMRREYRAVRAEWPRVQTVRRS